MGFGLMAECCTENDATRLPRRTNRVREAIVKKKQKKKKNSHRKVVGSTPEKAYADFFRVSPSIPESPS